MSEETTFTFAVPGGGAPWPPTRTDRHEALEELSDSVRRLVEATVGTGHDAAELRQVAAEVDALAGRLGEELDEDPWSARASGVGIADAPHLMGINPAIGTCNPVAPVVSMDAGDSGVSGKVRFGLAHVGPPYRAHGGIVALLFDQVLGAAVFAGGSPGFTRSMTVTYRRATPIREDLTFEGRFTGVEGRSSRATAVLRDADGNVTAEAEGVFMQPRDRA